LYQRFLALKVYPSHSLVCRSQAFRIVTHAPIVLLKSASKGIRESGKHLQEGFAGARKMLSKGDRRSTVSSNSSVNSDSEGKGRRERRDSFENLLHGFRVKFSSFGSHSQHSAGSGAENKAKKVMASRSTTHSSLDDSSVEASHDGHDSSNSFHNGGSPLQSVKTNSIFRAPSALSSACSYGSTHGSDAYAFNEDDESSDESIELPLNIPPEEEDEIALAETNNDDDKKVPPEQKPEATESTEAMSSELCEKATDMKDADKTASKAAQSPSSGDGVVPAPNESNNDTSSTTTTTKVAKKRRRKSRDKDSSKCVIQ
jgi:hypothetical protein